MYIEIIQILSRINETPSLNKYVPKGYNTKVENILKEYSTNGIHNNKPKLIPQKVSIPSDYFSSTRIRILGSMQQ